MQIALPRLKRNRQGPEPLADRVHRQVLDAILSGHLAAGATVNELALARALGVSRTPMHAAVVVLIKDGIVHQDGRRRPVVARFGATDVRELYEMRALLETEATARAAGRIDRALVAQLRGEHKALRALADPVEQHARWADLDARFHAAIAEAADNRRLAKDILRYRTIHRALNRALKEAPVIPQAISEHLAVLAALERRDAVGAREAMRAHLQEWSAYYARRIAEFGRPE
jgi:DNA-binding GntR family transcriptional regulator